MSCSLFKRWTFAQPSCRYNLSHKVKSLVTQFTVHSSVRGWGAVPLAAVILKLSHSQVTSGATPPAVSALPRDFLAPACGPCLYEELERLLNLRWAGRVSVTRWSTETRKMSSSAHRQSILQSPPPPNTCLGVQIPRQWLLGSLLHWGECQRPHCSHSVIHRPCSALCNSAISVVGSCVLHCGIQPDNQSP